MKLLKKGNVKTGKQILAYFEGAEGRNFMCIKEHILFLFFDTNNRQS